jgi:N-acetylglucosamine kinase-like BadF-type ATPase
VDASLASLRAHGAMLISGTGSVCKGLSAQGQPVQAGGLGAHLSGDPGSAFSAGRHAVIDYLNLKNGSEVFDPETGDFIGKDDPLFSAVSVDLEKRFPGIVAALVPHLNAQQAERAQMAELAPMVFEYAFDRQPASRLAKKIVNQVAQELAVQQAEVMVPVLKKDPHLKGIPFKVFLAGGIFESPHGEKFLSLIQEKLESMLKPSWPYVSMKWDYAFAENQTSRMVQNVGSFLLEQQSKNASRSPSLKSAT